MAFTYGWGDIPGFLGSERATESSAEWKMMKVWGGCLGPGSRMVGSVGRERLAIFGCKSFQKCWTCCTKFVINMGTQICWLVGCIFWLGGWIQVFGMMKIFSPKTEFPWRFAHPHHELSLFKDPFHTARNFIHLPYSSLILCFFCKKPSKWQNSPTPSVCGVSSGAP